MTVFEKARQTLNVLYLKRYIRDIVVPVMAQRVTYSPASLRETLWSACEPARRHTVCSVQAAGGPITCLTAIPDIISLLQLSKGFYFVF